MGQGAATDYFAPQVATGERTDREPAPDRGDSATAVAATAGVAALVGAFGMGRPYDMAGKKAKDATGRTKSQ